MVQTSGTFSHRCSLQMGNGAFTAASDSSWPSPQIQFCSVFPINVLYVYTGLAFSQPRCGRLVMLLQFFNFSRSSPPVRTCSSGGRTHLQCIHLSHKSSRCSTSKIQHPTSKIKNPTTKSKATKINPPLSRCKACSLQTLQITEALNLNVYKPKVFGT